MSSPSARVHVTAPFLPSPSLRVAILHVASWSVHLLLFLFFHQYLFVITLLPLATLPFLSPIRKLRSGLASHDHCRRCIPFVRRIEIRGSRVKRMHCGRNERRYRVARKNTVAWDDLGSLFEPVRARQDTLIGNRRGSAARYLSRLFRLGHVTDPSKNLFSARYGTLRADLLVSRVSDVGSISCSVRRSHIG